MCLIVLGWKTHPDYPLIMVANRDEFRQRPTTPLHAWETQPVIYAGQDQTAQGTWLGITPEGRFAAVTNLRRLEAPDQNLRSRGQLVREYLLSRQQPTSYLEQVEAEASQYPGFNLLVGTPRQLIYFTNQKAHSRSLTRGIYGISNAPIPPLDKAWPKVEESKVAFTRLISRREPDFESLLDMMRDTRTYPEQLLPETGLPADKETALSAIFVSMENYGTRSTSLLAWHRTGNIRLIERTYSGPGPENWQQTEQSFQLAA